jgi:hypothetical protein
MVLRMAATGKRASPQLFDTLVQLGQSGDYCSRALPPGALPPLDLYFFSARGLIGLALSKPV